MKKRKEIERTIEQTIRDINYCIGNAEPEDISPTTIKDIEIYKECLEGELEYVEVELSYESYPPKEILSDFAHMIGGIVGFVLMPVFGAAAIVGGIGYLGYIGGKAAYNKVKKHHADKNQTSKLENRL